jgi:hypothetical protein
MAGLDGVTEKGDGRYEWLARGATPGLDDRRGAEEDPPLEAPPLSAGAPAAASTPSARAILGCKYGNPTANAPWRLRVGTSLPPPPFFSSARRTAARDARRVEARCAAKSLVSHGCERKRTCSSRSKNGPRARLAVHHPSPGLRRHADCSSVEPTHCLPRGVEDDANDHRNGRLSSWSGRSARRRRWTAPRIFAANCAKRPGRHQARRRAGQQGAEATPSRGDAKLAAAGQDDGVTLIKDNPRRRRS